MNRTVLTPVGEALIHTTRKHKIKRSEYRSTGELPVVDQGVDLIGGYIDDFNRGYDGELPVIVFGDHTCAIKYVPFRFAVGADGTQILRPNKEWHPRYFYYCLREVNVAQFGYQRHFKYLREQSIPFRPMAEQVKIAAILAAYDELIMNNLRRVGILEEMAQAVYREWFINFRFPGYEDVALVDSSLGPIPEGWEISAVEEQVERLNAGRTYRGSDVQPYGSVVVVDQSRNEVLGFHDDAPAHWASPDRPIVIFGDHTCKMKLMVEPFSIGPNVIPFQSSSDRGITYLFFAIRGAVNTTEYKRHWTTLMTQQLLWAPAPLSRGYEVLVRPMMTLAEALGSTNRILRSIRDLLLPRLVSGEIDVSDLEIDTEWLAG